MRRVAAITIVNRSRALTVLALVALLFSTAALSRPELEVVQDEGANWSSMFTLTSGDEVWSENFSTRQSAFWVRVDCPSESACEELTLTVTGAGGNQFTDSGRFHLEMLGNVSYGVVNVKLERAGVTSQEISIQHIFFDTFSGEFGDAPNQIPTPAESDSGWPMVEVDGCRSIRLCGVLDRSVIDPSATWLNGTLDSIEDADSYQLNSSVFDLVEIQVEAVSADITLEIWNRTADDLTLLSTTQYTAGSDFSASRKIVEQTTGEVWLSISGMGSEYTLYSLRIANHSQYYELDETTEGYDLPTNPYIFHDENSTMSGHLISGDAGDSLVIKSGSRSNVTLGWYLSGDAEVHIMVRQGNWQTPYVFTERVGSHTMTTPEGSELVAFLITNHTEPLIWSTSVQTHGPWDAGGNGDALDDLPSRESDMMGLTHFKDRMSGSFSGEIGGMDIRDVYLVERPVGHPYETILNAQIEGDIGCCLLKLIQLNTSNYFSWTTVAWNSTEMGGQQATTTLDLPDGPHLLVVESRSEQTTEYAISWAWQENGLERPSDGEWVDYSSEMKGFYIVIGIVLLLPLLVVYLWSLKEKGVEDMHEHQKLRLARLLERLTAADPSDDMDPHALLHALDTLRDTDWDRLVFQWGEPLTRHITDGLDVAVWRLTASEERLSVAVGLAVAESEWNLAAMRFQAVEGSPWTVESVTPSAMYQGDEVFLGDLLRGSKHFYRIDLSGVAVGFDLLLSGMMGGEPIAAIPPSAAMVRGVGDAEEE